MFSGKKTEKVATSTSTEWVVTTRVVERRRTMSLSSTGSLPNAILSNATPSFSSNSVARFGYATDARALQPSPATNLNYQSPYRNSPVYSSLRHRPTANTQNTPINNFGQSPSTHYRAALPATTVPLPVPTENTKIKVKKTGTLYDKNTILPTYQTHSKNRGEALILNNIMFKGKGERHGAKVDDKNLKDLFKQIGFNVKVERDLKGSEMLSKVKSFSKSSSLKTADIAVLVVMSHGTTKQTLASTEVFGLDEHSVHVDEILEFFNESDCKAMADKPKIFIFQCCRGDNEQFVESDASRTPAHKAAVTNTLIAYSTLPGYVSHRDPTTGTWYIRTLCEVFSEHAHEHHVEDLLKLVDNKLNQSVTNNIKQTTHYENRGFKRCFLHPK